MRNNESTEIFSSGEDGIKLIIPGESRMFAFTENLLRILISNIQQLNQDNLLSYNSAA